MSPPGAHFQAPNPPNCPASCAPISEQNPPHPIHQPSGWTPERLPAPPSALSSSARLPAPCRYPVSMAKGSWTDSARPAPPATPCSRCCVLHGFPTDLGICKAMGPLAWSLPSACPLHHHHHLPPPPSPSPSLLSCKPHSQASLSTGGSLPADTMLSLSGGAQAPRGLPQSPLSQAGSQGSSHISPTPPSPEALIAPFSP